MKVTSTNIEDILSINVGRFPSEITAERQNECIGQVFVSSVCNVPCMYGKSVCFSYETACKAGSYVCTYGAILRIRRTGEYQ